MSHELRAQATRPPRRIGPPKRNARAAGILTLLCALLAGSTPLAHGGTPARWIPRGPGGGGALFAPAFNPHDTGELLVNCDMGQVFRTRNLGGAWVTLDFRQIQGGSMEVYAPQYTADPAVLYAINYANEVRTPVRSNDGGRTWQTLSSDPTDGEAYSLYADPATTNRLLVADYKNIYFSTNSGVTFAAIYSASDCHVAGVFFDAPRIFVCTQNGLLRSTNNGQTFAALAASGLPAGQSPVTFTGARAGATTRFFCVTLTGVWPGLRISAEHWSYAGIYRMDNPDAPAWTAVTTGIVNDDHPYFISMSRTNVSIAYVAGARSDAYYPVVYQTVNAGASWQRVLRVDNNENVATGWQGAQGDRQWSYGELPFGFQVCPTDPRRAVMTDYGFVHLTTNSGLSWSQAYVYAGDQHATNQPTAKNRLYHSVGLENTTCWGMAWLDRTNLFACYTDIMGCHSTNAGVSWGFPSGLTYNSTYQAVKHPSSNILYAAASSVHDLYAWDRFCKDDDLNAGSGALIYATNAATGWQVLHDFGDPVAGLALDPQNPRRMLAAVVHGTLGGIFLTTNLQAGTAATWSKLAAPPRTEGHPYQVRILNDGTLVCTYSARITTDFTASSGVFVSTNNGATWADRSDANMRYYTKDLLIDPCDPSQQRWYAGVWGEWGNSRDRGGLYLTTNRGATWTRITSGLTAVESCTVNPANSNELFVTTERQGLWLSTNRYATTPTFTAVTEYPFRFPTRVIFNPHDTNEIWVLSFGNGMKMGRIVDPPPTISAATRSMPATLQTTAEAGQTLVFETSTNLATWCALATNTALDQMVFFVDSASSDQASRFYRIRVSTLEE
jgi:hypothetical protein